MDRLDVERLLAVPALRILRDRLRVPKRSGRDDLRELPRPQGRQPVAGGVLVDVTRDRWRCVRVDDGDRLARAVEAGARHAVRPAELRRRRTAGCVWLLGALEDGLVRSDLLAPEARARRRVAEARGGRRIGA